MNFRIPEMETPDLGKGQASDQRQRKVTHGHRSAAASSAANSPSIGT